MKAYNRKNIHNDINFDQTNKYKTAKKEYSNYKTNLCCKAN